MILNNQALAHILARLSILFLGDSLFTLRWASVCISVLGVVFIYKIAHYLFGTRVGLMSACLLALSPYSIFFAHTFRGYSGVIAWPMLVALLALLAVRHNRWFYWVGLGFAAAAMLYNHLFTIFALINLWGLIGLAWLFRRRLGGDDVETSLLRRLLLSLGLTVVILSLLYAPILSKMLRATAGAEEGGDVLWTQRPQVSASVWYNLWLFNGFWQRGSAGGQGAYLLLGLILLGIVMSFREKNGFKTLFLLSWALLPFLEIWLIKQLLTNFWARPPYLGYVLPPLLILAGFASAGLPHYGFFRRLRPAWVSLLPIVLLAGLWYPSLREYYHVFAGAEWGRIGDFLQKNSTPDDLVICQRYIQPWQEADIEQEDLCTRSLDYRRVVDTDMAAHVSTSHELVYGLLPQAHAGLINRFGRVWLVVWDVPDSTNLAPMSTAGFLTQAEFDRLGQSVAFLADQQKTYVANLAQALAALRATTDSQEQQYIYGLMIAPLAKAGGDDPLAQEALAVASVNQPDHPESAAKLETTEQLVRDLSGLSPLAIENSVTANFGEEILLNGYTSNAASVTPGEQVELIFFWEGIKKMTKDYTIFLHLRDRNGNLIAQFDDQPFYGSYPTRSWQPGQSLREVRTFIIPSDFPAGEYKVVIGFYDQETLERLPLVNDQSGEHALFLTTLVVEPAR